MTERWNITSALRGGLGAGTVGSGSSNGGSNGIGNNGSAEFSGNGGDGRSATTFSTANGESGILRKTGHYHHHGGAPENFDDLLVFGYSCKVFRDDEKARFIDQGRHLIPWMGDNQLKIDRYDARGALHDLAPYEPPPGGYQNRLEGLTAAEQKAEQLCEEERYYSLYNNEVEEEHYQEEALKRQKMLGNQVPFNYDAPQTQDGAIVATVEDRTANSADEQDDDPYEPPKNFEIPPDIALPESMKEHAIIEKTAKFIASQDAQMEILLKTKQANNPQFEFLTQGTRLFRYYRHVLLAFRTNQYPSEADQPGEDENGPAGGTEADGDADLAAQVRPKIVVPAIKYKPSVDCAYTQLISKITGAPIPTFVADEADSQAEVAMNAQQQTSLNTEFDYYPESSTSSASVEVKKVSTGLAGLVQYDSESGGSDDEPQENNGQGKGDGGKQEKDIGPFQGVLPPVTVQHVIDRTAIYVAKNGYSFEEALRVKNDPRFVFLNRAHEYYPYYAYLVRQRMTGGGEEIARLQPPAPPSPTKVTIRTETENGTVVETTPSLGIKAVHTAVPKVVPLPVTNIQHQKLGAPVSFSLVVRKAKEDGGATAKTMPGLGGSEDEDEEEAGGNQRTEECCEHKQPQPDEGTECPTMEVTVETDAETKEVPTTGTNVATEDIASELLEETVEALEIKALPIVSDLPPAPEPAISKEKQAERKKRANMFVNLIKQQPKVAGEDTAEEKKTITDEKIAKAVSATNSDAEEGSIHSVHSTSPSPKKDTTVPLVTADPTCTSTTVIDDDDDDDDDDVVLVSETRPLPARSRSRHTRSKSKHETGERRAKKKKSKSRHRSSRGKKKSKKKSGSRSRSVSRARSDRSASRVSRSRKRHSRSRRGEERTSRSTSRSTAGSASSRPSKRRSISRHSSRSNRIKRNTKRPKHTTRSRSRTPEVSRSSKRASSTDRRRKETRRSREPSQGKKRKHRSRSRSSQRKHDSDTENRHRRKHRRAAGDAGHDGYDERYPPTRGRYWDC